MIYHFGPDIKEVDDRLVALAGNGQPAFLWLDFHGSATETNWETIRALVPKFRCLACIVPSPSALGVNLVALYERLSFLAIQPEKVLVCLFCNGNETVDARQREFLAAHLIQTDVTKIAFGVYHFFAKEILWSPTQIRHRFRIGLAKKILLTAWQYENAHIASYVPTTLLPWRQDMREAFLTETGQREEAFATAMAQANFIIDPTEITSRYGYGRPTARDMHSSGIMLEELLAPERNRSSVAQTDDLEQAAVFPLFLDANRPESRVFATLPDVLDAVETGLPTFYDFPETTSADIQFSRTLEEFDETSLTALQARRQINPFWSEPDGFAPFRERLAQLPALMEHYSNGRGVVRRHQQETFARELDALVADFRGLVDTEEASIRGHGRLLMLNPAPFHVAYSEVWRQILQPTLSLRLASWGSRRFLLPLPPWLPGPIHCRTAIMRRLHDLISEIVRLLNLYQHVANSLSYFRNDLKASMTVVRRLNDRIDRLRRHRDNIVEELEIADILDREPDCSPATIRFEKKLPDPEAVLEEMLNLSAQKVPQIVQEELFPLIQESHRQKNVLSDNVFASFLPCIYQNEDAWRAAKAMLGVTDYKIFTEIITLPHAAPSEYVVQCEWKKIPSLAENSEWRKLKREALLKLSTPIQMPFQHDAVVRLVPDMDSEVLATWIIETGLAKGIFLKDERQWIGLASKVAAPWLPLEARRLFFQCCPGLDLTQFLKRYDSHILWALKAWLCYASIANCRDNGENSMIPPPDNILVAKSPEEVWDLLELMDECEPDPGNPHPLSHPYFGQPKKDKVHFMLVDTLDPRLMRLFEVGRVEGEFATRYFPETYAISLFRDNAELRNQLFSLIFDLCIFWGEDPPFPLPDLE